jgi:phage terminase small subunit
VSDTGPKKKRVKPQRPPLGERLGVREVKFAHLYAMGGTTASQAYRDAGFDPAPPEAVHLRAFRLLRNVRVQQLIHDLRQQALDTALISVHRIAQGLARAAFADRRDLFAEDGTLLPPREWPPDIAACVESVKLADGVPVEVRTAKRMDALRALAAWMKMLGNEAAGEEAAPAPLVIGGEANPDAL